MTLLDALAPSREAVFPLDAASLDVRTPLGPVGFHELLRDVFANAKKRITIASLYYGTGTLEAELLGDISSALRASPTLEVRLLFDHSRGRRRTKAGSSATFVGERLDHERVQLFLHRLPQLAGVARALPSPLNELLAVCHFKVMVVDDVAVLTGANLSDEYFHCRHARVILVRDAKFADMLDGVVRIACEHSRRVRDRGAREEEPARPPEEVGARVVEHVVAAARAAARAADVHALPLFQHPRLGLAQERALLNRMFSFPNGELFIHTPYTNMQADYLASLATRLAAKAPRTSLLLASRHSHSFTTGRGFKALVPGFYAEREHHMHTQLRLLSGSDIELSYYQRPGWVFHSKGVWLRSGDETATIIGSSSFGARSVARDFDLSVLLVTKDERLREAFAGELSTTAPYVKTGARAERPLSSLITSPIVRSYM